MVNLGNTCYMNSFLQALFRMKDFRDALLSIDESLFLLNEETDQKVTVQAKVKLGLYQLQRLFAQLTNKSIRPTVAPKLFQSMALPDNFKGRHGFGGEQHDTSEFARIFLDKIEREIKMSPKLENINKRYLEGQKVRRV